MVDAISNVLKGYPERMQEIVKDAEKVSSLIPSWAPKDADHGQKLHMSKLAIPVVGGAPSLLLHALGEERTELDKERAKHISDIFTFDKPVCVRNSTRFLRLAHLDVQNAYQHRRLRKDPLDPRWLMSSLGFLFRC